MFEALPEGKVILFQHYMSTPPAPILMSLDPQFSRATTSKDVFRCYAKVLCRFFRRDTLVRLYQQRQRPLLPNSCPHINRAS
jgi:hypothetical protein